MSKPGVVPERLAQLPPSISLDSPLLSSLVALPAKAQVAYAVFTPVDSAQHLNAIESARRHLVSANAHLPILECLLPSVQVTRHSQSLHVFAISSVDNVSNPHAKLNSLCFDGLVVSGPDAFTPHDIYPCSLACSSQRNPCPTCLNPSLSQQPGPSSLQSSPCTECLLPRRPLRDAYLHFLRSVRDHLIHQISQPGKSRKSVTRYLDGFLLKPSYNSSEWGTGWEHYSQNRTLIHCQLEVHLSPTRLTIHPILRPTEFVFLHSTTATASGTPIKLLPYGTPAFYLAAYTGPTSAITAQFEASLSGLGAGDWRSHYKRTSGDDEDPPYVIAWISVQNKQGEDKGITIIWPASLCLSFVPSSPQSRSMLPYIPELPAQLQPSPPPPVPPSATLSNMPMMSPREMDQPLPSFQSRPFMARGKTSPTSASLHALRALTIHKSTNVQEVANEASSYVDAVAKEREKERERMRKDRELAQSPSKLTTQMQNQNPISSSTLPVDTKAASPIILAGVVQSDLTPGVEPMVVDATPLKPTSPIEPSRTNIVSVHEPPAAQDVKPSPVVTYEPFPTFDTPWSRPAAEFPVIDMDYDMGFGISMDSMDERPASGGNAERFGMDIDDGFGAFTDDDFSFFDRPASQIRATESASASIRPMGLDSGIISSTQLGSLGLPSPLYNDGSGPGPPSATLVQSHLSPWTSAVLGEGFTPRFAESHGLTESTPYVPDLVSSSPTSKTPSSHSAPVTPAVNFAPESFIRRRPSFLNGPPVFDPISFASSHRTADAKYAFGKFALPSPPDEEDRTESFSFFFTTKKESWKSKYNAVTDPRISVVRKLIGAKRKSGEQGGRDGKVSPSWVRDQEEWQSSVMTPPEEPTKSDVESDDDEDEKPLEDDDVPRTGNHRPSTPSPSYLPLGPSLLATQFHHFHLLPISTSLRPPAAIVAATNLGTTTAPINVPTPVSPPAMLGEKSRSLEAAANMLAREAVENHLWAECCRVNTADSKFSADVCQADVKRVTELFKGFDTLEGPLQMKLLFDFNSAALLTSTSTDTVTLHAMEPPLLSLGKADVGIEILPPALRFWEKLGLTPRGGAKDVAAYVFVEDEGEERMERASRWLRKISAAYSMRNLGTHIAGQASSCTLPGIVPIRFDTFRKTLPSFISDLPDTSSYLVFYITTPASMTSLASPNLRQVFSAAKRALKDRTDSQILFQFVPETFVQSSVHESSPLDDFVNSVYNRILKPVDRSMSRAFFTLGAPKRKFFQDPSFALGRPRQNKVALIQQTPIRSLDVLDRHTLLHVGYRVSSCGKWLLAACVDQRGENHELGVWLNQQEEGTAENALVDKLWDFAISVAKEANVEWRIVFAKSGMMGEREMHVWVTKLKAFVQACEEIPMLQATLVSVELDASWTFIAPTKKAPRPQATTQSKNPAGLRFEDVSTATYAILPPVPMALSPVPLRSRDTWSTSHLVEDHDETPSPEMSVRALSTATIISIPADTDYTSISMLRVHLLHTIKSPLSSLRTPDEETHLDIIHNFHELAVLAKMRWKLDKKVNPVFPFHLAALNAMDDGLAGELPVD